MKKVKYISFRVTEEKYELIKNKANNEKRTISDYMGIKTDEIFGLEPVTDKPKSSRPIWFDDSEH